MANVENQVMVVKESKGARRRKRLALRKLEELKASLPPPSPPLREFQGYEPMKVDSTFHLGSVMNMAAAKEFWHKFIVLGGASLDRNIVMKTVLNSGFQTEFIPVLYRIESPHATFLARGCVSTIHKLFQYRFKLMLDGYDSPDKLITVELILCFAHMSNLDVNIQKALDDCVLKRYNWESRSLDLSDFAEDPVLVDSCYCPLWLPKVMVFVLQKMKFLRKPIVHILLNKNELTTIKSNKNWQSLTSVRSIDLSENKLDSLDCLTAFQSLSLTELRLDKNPLCEPFSKDEYIKEVLTYVPSLKKLDGVLLGGQNMPPPVRNYASKGKDLVNQFMERFFTIYDSQRRGWLRGFYHDEACFSLTANFLEGQSTSSTARLTRYTFNSRNLLKISNYIKNHKLLLRGPNEILSTIMQLPQTEHDPYSFCVDVVLYNGKCAVFTVNGVFREYFSNNSPLIRSFSRSFVLVWVASQQYQICNEMLSISNATTEQAKAAFRIERKLPCLAKIALSAHEPLTEKDQEKMAECMSELTEMNVRWSRKCLEESKWQFREALQVFTELLKMDRIPDEAFTKEEPMFH